MDAHPNAIVVTNTPIAVGRKNNIDDFGIPERALCTGPAGLSVGMATPDRRTAAKESANAVAIPRPLSALVASAPRACESRSQVSARLHTASLLALITTLAGCGARSELTIYTCNDVAPGPAVAAMDTSWIVPPSAPPTPLPDATISDGRYVLQFAVESLPDGGLQNGGIAATLVVSNNIVQSAVSRSGGPVEHGTYAFHATGHQQISLTSLCGEGLPPFELLVGTEPFVLFASGPDSAVWVFHRASP